MTRIIELAAYAPAYLILADLAWVCLTQAMWAIDALIGDDNAD